MNAPDCWQQTSCTIRLFKSCRTLHLYSWMSWLFWPRRQYFTQWKQAKWSLSWFCHSFQTNEAPADIDGHWRQSDIGDQNLNKPNCSFDWHHYFWLRTDHIWNEKLIILIWMHFERKRFSEKREKRFWWWGSRWTKWVVIFRSVGARIDTKIRQDPTRIH